MFSKAKIETPGQVYSIVFDFEEGFKFKSKTGSSKLSGGKKPTKKKSSTKKPKTNKK